MPKPVHHLLFFQRVIDAGHLERLEIVFPNCIRKADVYGSYLSLAARSNIQEVSFHHLPRCNVLLFLDLLPKLRKVHIVVDGSNRYWSKSYENITRKLSKLTSITKITDLGVKILKKSKPVLDDKFYEAVNSRTRICDVLRSASSLTSLELLIPHWPAQSSEILSILKGLRSLSTTGWFLSDLNGRINGRKLAGLSNLTKLELWTDDTDNLRNVTEITTLKELKLRVTDDYTLHPVGQTQCPQLTSLDLALIRSKKKVPDACKKSIPAFLNSMADAFPSLTKLCIGNMGLDILSQGFLSFVPELTHLSLADNEFTNLPSFLYQLVHLEELSVRRNPIHFDDKDLAMIAALPELKTIIVQGPRHSKNVYQNSWVHLHSTFIEKLRRREPRILVKEIVPSLSAVEDASRPSIAVDDYEESDSSGSESSSDDDE